MDTSSASTSTAAHPNNSHLYDVFINHRGPDTKKNFASNLYRRLLLHGFEVFLDQKELQQGDYLDSQIEAAIESASVHVAIFSPQYAQSPWCLKELDLMLKTGAAIIPVFYKVKPSELRWTEGQKGLYAEALHKHEQKQRYDPPTLEQWRNALSHVAGISGFELEACNGDKGELLEKVVERVLKKVKTPGLYVAKYPIGLDEKVEHFQNTVLLPQQQSGKPPIFGIVGLGGVGKTTLAKEIFNRKKSYYGRSCFLSDVRDNADRNSLISLQRELLKRLSLLDQPIDNVHEGTGTLKKHLSYSNALVILDDVNDENQVYDLLPDVEIAVRSDSLIIITSPDKAVLRRARVEETSIYKLNGLQTQHSRQLFCSYAFSQTDPLPGFESLVDNFIDACDGLPLSLKIFGSLVYGKDDQSEWQNQLESLLQILPTEIHQRLKISYDALNEEEKQIFLDIACFFIGEKKDKTVRIWNGSGWKGILGFQNLFNKCLVELDSENNIRMHDHLRDMGRDIAKDSNLQLPLRFCSWPQDLDDLLQQSYEKLVPTAVRGIMVHHITGRFNLMPSKMSSFKRSIHELLGSRLIYSLDRLLHTHDGFLGVSLLDVEKDDMERILRRVKSPNVVWIRWYRCPYSSLPSWIPVKNLTVLEVNGCVLETLWQNESQAPLQLRELHIFAPLLSIPKSIGYLKHLERIVIDFPTQRVNLEKLPDEFCRLQSLKTLVLRNCEKLKSLPDSFGDLINLEHLELDRSYTLRRLPNSFGNLTRLKYLDLKFCVSLTISSETLGNISKLEHLDLSSCWAIEELPRQVFQQRYLAVLLLIGTGLKEWPSAIRDLSDLEVLKIGSRSLRSVVLPSGSCPLGELPFTGLMPRLQHLRITAMEISEISFGGGACPNLQDLIISDCNKLEKIEGLCGLPKLRWLKIDACRNLEELPNVEHCRSLKTLEILKYGEPKLKEEAARQLREQGWLIIERS